MQLQPAHRACVSRSAAVASARVCANIGRDADADGDEDARSSTLARLDSDLDPPGLGSAYFRKTV